MTAELVDTDIHADWGPERSRTVTWHSPGPSNAKGLAMSGIDYLRAVVDGALPQPPIAGLMQFDFVEVEPDARYSLVSQTNPRTTRSAPSTAD